MRIPHYINKNTRIEYEPSPETLMLVGENRRVVISEDFEEWDKFHCQTLAELCVAAIAKNFAKKQILNELPCPNKEHLFELLPTDLDLEIVVPLIDYEYYWYRRYSTRFGLVMLKPPPNWTWKSLYIEKHVEDLVEQAEPQYHDEEDMSEVLKLCAPYITRLIITQLQAWKPPLTWEKDDIPEIYPIDHINFVPVLSKLPNIEELDVVYGMNKVGDKFNWNMFKLSVQDCQRLGKAILSLKLIKIFRLHRSRITDEHVQVLMQQLVKNTTIEDLDLSNCHISDSGAKCIAKLLLVHPKLKILNVSNNRIGEAGAYSLGYALQEAAFTLEVFNIKLNPIGYDGAVAIMTGVLHGHRVKNLIIAGCEFEDATSIRMCNFLTVDTTLKKCDVTNNWFDTAGGKAMVEALEVNKVIEWLDMRETDISPEQLVKINKLLLRNRGGEVEKEEEEAEREEGEQEEQKEEGDEAHPSHGLGKELVAEEGDVISQSMQTADTEEEIVGHMDL